MIEGLVVKSYGKLCNVKVDNLTYKCEVRGKYKFSNKFSNPVVSGDKVEISITNKNNGVVENILERKNYFAKESIRDKKGHLIGSNIDQTLIIFSIKNPYTKLIFLDKCLLSSIFFDIKPIIVFNKIDLLNEDEIIKLDKISFEYKKAGFDVISISAKYQIRLDDIKSKLIDKRTLILGNSGVGKSTLINQLSPYSQQRISDISQKTGKGKQTTTFSEIFKINKNTLIIDTPGFKDFNLYLIDKSDIKYQYPEFNKFFDNCKFSNCSHINEPGCAVKKQIGDKIWDKRYNNYLAIIEEYT